MLSPVIEKEIKKKKKKGIAENVFQSLTAFFGAACVSCLFSFVVVFMDFCLITETVAITSTQQLYLGWRCGMFFCTCLVVPGCYHVLLFCHNTKWICNAQKPRQILYYCEMATGIVIAVLTATSIALFSCMKLDMSLWQILPTFFGGALAVIWGIGWAYINKRPFLAVCYTVVFVSGAILLYLVDTFVLPEYYKFANLTYFCCNLFKSIRTRTRVY